MHRLCLSRPRSAAITLLLAFTIAVAPYAAAQPAPAQDEKTAEKPAEGLVLPRDRTITFTTDEVTWMSVDVSPDGRTIVFDVLGDLYTMPVDGGDRDADHGRPVVREPADVVARRQDDRLPQRPHRRREPVDRRRRRRQPARGQQGSEDQRPSPDHGVAGVDARRPVPRRVEDPSAGAGHVRPLHVSPRRRHRRPHRLGAPSPAQPRQPRARPPAPPSTAWAPSCRPTAASSTTRSARAPSPTTRGSRCGRSTATIARPAT